MSYKEIKELITQLNSHSWSSKREDAAWELGEYKKEALIAVPSLIEALKDKSSDVQFYAAEALGKIGSEKGLKPLQKLIFEEEYNMVLQTQCLLSIAMIRTDKARDFLMSIIRNTDYCPVLRSDATIALGRMRSKVKNERLKLIKIFNIEEEDLVKEEIITTIGKSCTRDKRVINFLIEIILNSNLRWQFRNRAVEALGRLYAINAYKEICQVLVFDQSDYARNTAAKTIKRLSLHFWEKHDDIVLKLILSTFLAYALEATKLEKSNLVFNQLEKTITKFAERLDDETFEELDEITKNILDEVNELTEEDLNEILSIYFELDEIPEEDVYDEQDDNTDYDDLEIERKIITNKFPIKVLFLGAAPSDQNNLYHKRELNLIKNRIQSKPGFLILPKFGVSIGEFINILQNELPIILHFSAHGSYGELILEDEETRQSDSISINKIASVIKVHNQKKSENNFVSHLRLKHDQTQKIANHFLYSGFRLPGYLNL